MRTFLLVRDTDPSGVSGTGVVAEGVEFSDGAVALHWVAGEVHSTAVFRSLAEVRAVHGHDGATRVVAADGEVLRRLEEAWAARRGAQSTDKLRRPDADSSLPCAAALPESGGAKCR